MDGVTVTTEFDGDLRELAERCRTLESRRAWPGAVLLGGGGAVLRYQVSMRLKAAAMTDIEVEERQTPLVEEADGTLRFSTTQKVTWPDGQAHGETDYVFTPGERPAMTFSYRYEPPPTKLVKRKALPAFHEGMRTVTARYVQGLTAPVPA